MVAWLRSRLARRRDEEDGQGMVEYGLILVLVALGCVLAVSALGSTINDQLYTNIMAGLSNAGL